MPDTHRSQSKSGSRSSYRPPDITPYSARHRFLLIATIVFAVCCTLLWPVNKTLRFNLGLIESGDNRVLIWLGDWPTGRVQPLPSQWVGPTDMGGGLPAFGAVGLWGVNTGASGCYWVAVLPHWLLVLSSWVMVAILWKRPWTWGHFG